MGRLLFIVAVIALCVWAVRALMKRRRERALLAAPLTPEQRSVVAACAPVYARLPLELQRALEGKINVFLSQIDFHGHEGLKITEEMRLTIAAQACLLVVNKEAWYKHLRTILVYPGAFKSQQVESDGYVETVRETVRTGESWARGPVILSWAHAKHGAFIDDDGHNVVLHEFAHQLDDLSGDTDGAPVLDQNHDGAAWTHAFREAYARLVAQVESGRETFLDPYGATAPAEFFAVAVEYFFEKPQALAREEPALYEQLSGYFKLDPASWREA